MLLPDHAILKKGLAITKFEWQSIGRRSFCCKIDKQMTKGICNAVPVLLLNPSSKVTKLSCFRGTWKRRKSQTRNCGQRTFNGLNALNVPLVDLGKVTIFAEDKQKTSPALRKKYLDCHAVVPEHHALLAQPLPDAIGQHGDHVDQGGHEVLPHHVLDVHQPASEPVVVRDVDAVAHKLVCLHLIRTSITIET